jgi:hypothetical protein
VHEGDKGYKREVWDINHINENKSWLKIVESRGNSRPTSNPATQSEIKRNHNPETWYAGKLKKYWNKEYFKPGRDKLDSAILVTISRLRNNKTDEAERLRFRIKHLWRLRNHRRGIWKERRTLTIMEKMHLWFEENVREVTWGSYKKSIMKMKAKQKNTILAPPPS